MYSFIYLCVYKEVSLTTSRDICLFPKKIAVYLVCTSQMCNDIQSSPALQGCPFFWPLQIPQCTVHGWHVPFFSPERIFFIFLSLGLIQNKCIYTYIYIYIYRQRLHITVILNQAILISM